MKIRFRLLVSALGSIALLAGCGHSDSSMNAQLTHGNLAIPGLALQQSAAKATPPGGYETVDLTFDKSLAEAYNTAWNKFDTTLKAAAAAVNAESDPTRRQALAQQKLKELAPLREAVVAAADKILAVLMPRIEAVPWYQQEKAKAKDGKVIIKKFPDEKAIGVAFFHREPVQNRATGEVTPDPFAVLVISTKK